MGSGVEWEKTEEGVLSLGVPSLKNRKRLYSVSLCCFSLPSPLFSPQGVQLRTSYYIILSRRWIGRGREGKGRAWDWGGERHRAHLTGHLQHSLKAAVAGLTQPSSRKEGTGWATVWTNADVSLCSPNMGAPLGWGLILAQIFQLKFYHQNYHYSFIPLGL